MLLFAQSMPLSLRLWYVLYRREHRWIYCWWKTSRPTMIHTLSYKYIHILKRNEKKNGFIVENCTLLSKNWNRSWFTQSTHLHVWTQFCWLLFRFFFFALVSMFSLSWFSLAKLAQRFKSVGAIFNFFFRIHEQIALFAYYLFIWFFFFFRKNEFNTQIEKGYNGLVSELCWGRLTFVCKI